MPKDNSGADWIFTSSFEQIVDTEEEAKEFGEQAGKLHQAYLDGFGESDG